MQIQNKKDIIIIVNCVNGHIHSPLRLPQFEEVCRRLDIVIKDEVILTKNSYYFAGFFDANGCISYNLNKLEISISHKYIVNIQLLQNMFCGDILFMQTEQGDLRIWRVIRRADILKITAYFKAKCKSNKSVLFFLVDDYFRLLDLHAYKSDNIHHNDWLLFVAKWEARTEFRTF